METSGREAAKPQTGQNYTAGREAAKPQTGAKPNLGQRSSQAADRGKTIPVAKTTVGLDIIGRFVIFVC